MKKIIFWGRRSYALKTWDDLAMIYYRVICVVAGFLHSLINSRLHLPFPENKLRLREMIRDQLKAVFVADGIRQCLHSSVYKCQQKPDPSPAGFANGKPRRSQSGEGPGQTPRAGGLMMWLHRWCKIRLKMSFLINQLTFANCERKMFQTAEMVGFPWRVSEGDKI